MAKQKKNKNESKGSGKGTVALMIVASLVLVVSIQLTFIFFILGILPSIVAFLIDRSPGRTTFHTIMACNMSGVLIMLFPLFADGNQPSTLMMMMTDVFNWFIIYMSAAFGWFLVWGSPYMGHLIINAFNQRHISKLEHTQKRLRSEWGPEVESRNNELE
ncbi:MAG: hypothetical protein CMM94_01555 [Rickettsiales bacterium]|nr:hypothetical protein [Rickettsiales bacterium]